LRCLRCANAACSDYLDNGKNRETRSELTLLSGKYIQSGAVCADEWCLCWLLKVTVRFPVLHQTWICATSGTVHERFTQHLNGDRFRTDNVGN
jgi:hypothetical protein